MSCCILWKLTPRRQHHLQTLSPSPHLSLCFMISFVMQNLLNPTCSLLFLFPLLQQTDPKTNKQTLLLFIPKSALPIFSSVCALSHVQLCAIPWTGAHQAPLSMEFSIQEYWSRLPFPFPRDLPKPGIKPVSLVSPAVAGEFFTS